MNCRFPIRKAVSPSVYLGARLKIKISLKKMIKTEVKIKLTKKSIEIRF